MGQSHSFTVEELDDYQDLTYFTKKEILHAFKRFQMLAPDKIGRNRNVRLSQDDVVALDELKVNPFRDRICKVFSSDGDGSLSFEDFLDMMSVFSDSAPRVTKTEYAFRIFDFDEDDFIGPDDLKEILRRLTGKQQLSEENLDVIVENILEEADMDKDDLLAFVEFEHIISKSPDFMSSFTIRL